MIGNILEDDLGDVYRQRGRWFLLLGALLGGIIAVATAFGFWLEKWGNHIGGGRGEDVHGIAVGLAIALLVVVIVIVLMVWRASTYLAKANDFVPATRAVTPQPSSTVSAAVAAWTSSALGQRSQGYDDQSRNAAVDRTPTPGSRSSMSSGSTDTVQVVTAITATELTIGSEVPDTTLAEIIRRVESSGVEIDGLWSAAGLHGNEVHLVLQRTADSDSRLAQAGLHIGSSQDIVLVDFEDRPGAAAEIIRRLTDAGVRVSSAQLATNSRMVIVSDDPNGATHVLQ